MELIDQHTKAIMEGCKQRARDVGLRFEDETLEYVVTNRDLLELSPKYMIPSLYDYWVHDVEVLKEKGKYELYPGNPYETVINTRPAVSFYNDNNPDWLNVMIFYHVLAHIDFFQNNVYFRSTWGTDFSGEALSDKRVIARLRSEHGRWLDYVIEFARGIDNLVGYFFELSRLDHHRQPQVSKRLDFYFDVFLQAVRRVKTHEYVREIERYNDLQRRHGPAGEKIFFTDVIQNHPEFDALFKKHRQTKPQRRLDLIQFLLEHSEFLNREKNQWMKTVLQIVRKTALFFQPQIRTKTMNEGWASYWHETLFLQDERIRGHEVEFARVNATVTSLPRLGLNPYALGMRLFQMIEEKADRGQLSFEYQRLVDLRRRRDFDARGGGGREQLFAVRRNECDFTFIQRYLNQDFVDRHGLFISGVRLNRDKMVWEFTVRSRKAEAYRRMLTQSLYHPPCITTDTDKSVQGRLYLVHRQEGKPLVKEYIANTMLGIEYLWGGPVQLETSEVKTAAAGEEMRLDPQTLMPVGDPDDPGTQWQRVVYTMQDRRLARRVL